MEANKRTLDVLAQLDLAETEVINAKAWSAGEQARKHCNFALGAIATARQAIAAAEQAPRWPQVDMGFGKFAVGSCTCAVTGVPGLLYLRLDEPRPHNADCSDVFPVGSTAPEGRIASVIHFHSAQALQQTIDELLTMQREHYPAAEQAQQAEPVAAQCRFEGKEEWSPCTLAHHLLVQAHPKEWPHYETRALYAQPPAVAVAVPDEMESVHDTPFMSADTEPEIAYRDGWNACRAAMLAAAQKGGA